jgi:hypothetical protein
MKKASKLHDSVAPQESLAVLLALFIVSMAIWFLVRAIG